MAPRTTARFLTLAAALLLAACGSRTPLGAEPVEDIVPEPPDSGPDVGPDVIEDPECQDSRGVGEIPIDLYFSLDRSRSMSTPISGSTKTRWEAVSGALSAFLASPQSGGLGAGIAFFPRTSAGGSALCSTSDYIFPVVPVAPLPGVGPSILRAISLTMLVSSTPTTPALDGAHVYMRQQQVLHPDHTEAVVLVTDGAPRDCGSDIPGTSAVAAVAVAGVPPIKTYVLGVGPNLSNLNRIAAAGGTDQAYLVETGGEASLLASLEAIRTSALRCEYVLPPAGPRPLRFDDTRVTTTTGADGVTTVVSQVAGAEACAGGTGWFFDNPVPPGNPRPTKILLCPASCSPLVQGKGNRLDVAIGCGGR